MIFYPILALLFIQTVYAAYTEIPADPEAVNGALTALTNSLSVAGGQLAKNKFLTDLKRVISEKIVMEQYLDVIGKDRVMLTYLDLLVRIVLELAMDNKMFDFISADMLVDNFRREITIWTGKDIDRLPISGNAAGVANFRAAAKLLLKAKEKGTRSSVYMAGLNRAAIDLLTANGIFQKEGANKLKRYFNL